MTPDLAVDLAVLPAPWARRGRDGVEVGMLALPDRITIDPAVLAPLAGAGRRRQDVAVLLSLRECVVARLARASGNAKQMEGAVRFQMAKALKRSPDAVTVDWTETPTAVVATGAASEFLTPLVERFEAGGLRIAGIEPAALALLRAVCHADDRVVMLLRLAADGVELTIGSGSELFLVRRFSWSSSAPDGIVLDVEETLRSFAGAPDNPPVQAVALAGDGELEAIAARLRQRLSIPAGVAALHPAWEMGQVAPAHLAAAGALVGLPPGSVTTIARVARAHSITPWRKRPL